MTLESHSLAIKCLLIGALLLFGVAVYALAFTLNKSPEPNVQSIKLDNAGVVADFKFKVRKRFPYAYSMEFHFPEGNELERTRIRNILGGPGVDKDGKPLEPGVPTPINLTIFAVCKDGQEVEVYSIDADPILTSWGSDSFGKDIGSHVMDAGMYRVLIVNKRASPALSSIPITFEIGMPAKINYQPPKDTKRSNPCQQ